MNFKFQLTRNEIQIDAEGSKNLLVIMELKKLKTKIQK
jgi:hypothetical protein